MNTKTVNEKLKRTVLLLLLEICTTLLEGDFKEASFHKIAILWRRFSLDFPDMLIRMFPTLYHQEPDIQSLLNSNPRLYRVGSLYRPCRSKFKSPEYVPRIRISGLWLEDYGFCMGKRFTIYPSNDQLILQRVHFSIPEPLKLKGGRNG